MIWFWLASAFCTSLAERPWACIAWGSRSKLICAVLAAERQRERGAGHRGQMRADEILRQVQHL